MVTTLVEVNPSTWVQLTTEADFIVQNTIKYPIKIHASDSDPVDESYLVVGPKEWLHSGIISGTLWGKSFRGNVSVVVTE